MGCVIVGVIGKIVFVDKWFYVVCDVILIVESIDLIIVLILLKKLVVGL